MFLAVSRGHGLGCSVWREEDKTQDPAAELYRIPPHEFTEARNALAKKLRSAGDEEAARRVTALKRPSLAIWAVNQLADADPEIISELIQTQRTLRSSPDAKELQELSRQRRRLVSSLSKKAAVHLKDNGLAATDQTLKRVTKTLLAANTPEEEELLQRGRLTEELDASGFAEAFGGANGFEVAADDRPSTAERRVEEKADALAAEAQEAKRDADDLATEAASLRRALEAAEVKARVARKKADDLAKKAKVAQARAGADRKAGFRSPGRAPRGAP